MTVTQIATCLDVRNSIKLFLEHPMLSRVILVITVIQIADGALSWQ